MLPLPAETVLTETGNFPLKTGLIGQDSPHRPNQGYGLPRCPNRDAQMVFYLRKVEPPDENFFCAQLVLPLLRGKAQRLNKNEIRLARENPETQRRQFATQPRARGDDPFEIR